MEKLEGEEVDLEQVLSKVNEIIEGGTPFKKYVEEQAEKDDTWKLWAQFVFEDCLAYVSLYLGFRSCNWDLRMSGLKQMAPLFAAYDRPTYSRILPHHIAEYQTFPKHVREYFEHGGFTVTVCGNSGRSLALDEAHEAMINKEMKAALARTSTGYLHKAVHYLRYRMEAHELDEAIVPNRATRLEQNLNVRHVQRGKSLQRKHFLHEKGNPVKISAAL